VDLDLQAEVEQLWSQLRQAVAHCTLTHDKINKLQEQINSKTSKRKKKNLNVNARCLTVGEGAALRDAAEVAHEAEDMRRQDACARKEQDEASKWSRHEELAADVSVEFSGKLSSKNKTDLQVIAAALGLQIDGTKATLQSSITNHLQLHPELRTNIRFNGLYPDASGSHPTKHTRPCDISDKNQPSPPQRKELTMVLRHRRVVR
jgi:hypothetical protein